jgi:hypothetical protein
MVWHEWYVSYLYHIPYICTGVVSSSIYVCCRNIKLTLCTLFHEVHSNIYIGIPDSNSEYIHSPSTLLLLFQI